MASGHRLRKLQRKVLQVAALGNVKLLRNLLHSHTRPSSNERRKSRKRGRDEDHELGARGSRRYRERSRKGEQREAREFRWRGKHRSKERGEGSNSVEESEGVERTDKEIRHSKRSRREEEIETNGNGRQEGSRSERGKGTDEQSFTSNDTQSSGKQSDHGSCLDSDLEGRNHSRSKPKNADPGETVRSLVNCRDAEGLTPLHHACQVGSVKLVKYLISKGASVHVRNSKGDTPLHIAAKLGPAALVDILKNADADMEAFNDQGVTPSEILSKKSAAAESAAMFKDQKQWYSHLADELSDNEDNWWGTEWGEEAEQGDWQVPLLEKMAESRQGRGVYNDEPFRLRDFLKAEKVRTQTEKERKSKKRNTDRASKHEKSKSAEVIGPTVKVPPETRSYRQRWKTFSESYNLCLSYSSVPFPVEEGKEDTLAEVLLQGINPSMHRAALRKEILKWHPDKFLQNWGAKLNGPDHDRIVARVNGISEAIHQLYTNLNPV